MGDLDLAQRIVRAVRRAVSIPRTVKFRLGIDDSRRNFLELGRICEAEGAEAVLEQEQARQVAELGRRGTEAVAHGLHQIVDLFGGAQAVELA